MGSFCKTLEGFERNLAENFKNCRKDFQEVFVVINGVWEGGRILSNGSFVFKGILL